MQNPEKQFSFLRQQKDWSRYWFYQKSEVLYLLSYYFTEKYMNRYKDRTVDQMVQAARSGQQNIIEGKQDGVTSFETEIKLLGIACGSIQELKKDFDDYINTRHLQRWDVKHPRYDGMLKFCRAHNRKEDYEQLFARYGEEELCNIGITLCEMTIRMMQSHMKTLELDFVNNGGIRERMTAARLGARASQTEIIKALQHDNEMLLKRIDELTAELSSIEGRP